MRIVPRTHGGAHGIGPDEVSRERIVRSGDASRWAHGFVEFAVGSPEICDFVSGRITDGDLD
jgi:hypothetical protein